MTDDEIDFDDLVGEADQERKARKERGEQITKDHQKPWCERCGKRRAVVADVCADCAMDIHREKQPRD